MKILIAPDSFKESLNAREVCRAIEEGIKENSNSCQVFQLPLSDGGEGLTEVITGATGGEIRREVVSGPLGNPVQAFWGISNDGKTAVIEMASASGLALLNPEERNPMITTTRGTGELIAEALRQEVKQVILGLGGSCTNDAGVGMARALGVGFYDSNGKEITEGARGLLDLDRIDIRKINPRLSQTEFLIACDVTNPLYGPTGAAYVYARQKGAREEDLPVLDKTLKKFSEVVKRDLNFEVDFIPGAGAAGGLGAGTVAFLNGRLTRGIELVLQAVRFEELLIKEQIDLVITGEGQVNEQSSYGKVVSGVAALSSRHGIPVVVIAGGIGPGYEKLYHGGVTVIDSIVNRPMALNEAIANAYDLIRSKAFTIIRLIDIGKRVKAEIKND